MSLFGLVGSHKTLRAKKNTPVGSKGLQLKRHIDATLGQGDIVAAVRLPPGEDLKEWLAVNTVDFYNAISVLYSTLAEFCTERSCEVMSAGGKFEYLWADGVRVRKPVRLSAPEYVDRLFDWVESQIDDSGVFPAQFGAPFPPDFSEVVRTIFRRLFRVYAHIYHSHFRQVCALGEEAHLNTCFKHFIHFVRHFDLVDERELSPLQELIEQFTAGRGGSAKRLATQEAVHGGGGGGGMGGGSGMGGG
ncbi:MOB kinase activator-like 1A [Raphidocelis subcapitata]|uniref:MOB kinase activator-like 1A n=1 Tax=Raphidocelis subcapitata TaxID=307507 RepID=A0A2V0NKZ2_9CHLO|nr:MOB kinase activator-like 1A [Raphidocelis subcapitata]|eukprot:GBF88028.1 MOB kinase activator-like 1A [Raphidocelis subcapitata]